MGCKIYVNIAVQVVHCASLGGQQCISSAISLFVSGDIKPRGCSCSGWGSCPAVGHPNIYLMPPITDLVAAVSPCKGGGGICRLRTCGMQSWASRSCAASSVPIANPAFCSKSHLQSFLRCWCSQWVPTPLSCQGAHGCRFLPCFPLSGPEQNYGLFAQWYGWFAQCLSERRCKMMNQRSRHSHLSHPISMHVPCECLVTPVISCKSWMGNFQPGIHEMYFDAQNN